MSTSDQRYKIIDTVDDCVAAVVDLLKQTVIAVDAEGVNLGKEGPLTLLQVARMDGFVYLFNLFVEPRLFSEGQLGSVLENEDIVKVFHECSKDSAALKCQFGVTVTNVFDIQTVHYVLDKAQGRQLPSPLKLVDLCKLYVDVSSLDGRDEIEEKWTTTYGAFWAKTTFTQDMIDYACAEVRIMIPDVYEKLKSILDDNKLWKEFEDRVTYETQFRCNDQVDNEETIETMSFVKKLLQQFERKYPRYAKLEDITDEDDINALKLIRIQDVVDLPDIVCILKNQYLQKEIDAIETEMEDKGEDYFPLGSHLRMVGFGKYSNDWQIQQKSERLNGRMDEILKKKIVLRHNETTPAKFLSADERRFMQRLGPETERSSDVILRHLYIVSIDADVEDIRRLRERFRQEGRHFSLPDTQQRKFKFFISAPSIPARLKEAARQFLNELQDAGIVRRPPRRHQIIVETGPVWVDL